MEYHYAGGLTNAMISNDDPIRLAHNFYGYPLSISSISVHSTGQLDWSGLIKTTRF